MEKVRLVKGLEFGNEFFLHIKKFIAVKLQKSVKYMLPDILQKLYIGIGTHGIVGQKGVNQISMEQTCQLRSVGCNISAGVFDQIFAQSVRRA